MSNVVFSNANRRLTFTLAVPTASEKQSLMVPRTYGGDLLNSVTVNGLPVAVTTQAINGREFGFFDVGVASGTSAAPANYSVAVNYAVPPPDTTPPAISSVSATPNSTTAVVTWTTDEPATSQVEYGTVSPTTATPVDSTLVLDHSVTLTGLSPQTNYVYRVNSTDAASNPASSPTLSFTTTAFSNLAVNDVSVNEGTGGTTTANFSVTLSPASMQTVTVQYTTTSGTAQAGSDFTASGGTITFTPGQTSAPVPVSIVTDGDVEPSETFTLALSSPTNASLADATGRGSEPS
jgi:hypothetical protein